jgi:CBS domain-containing protein
MTECGIEGLTNHISQTRCNMNATHGLVHSLTAADVMKPDLVVVPQQMPVREAARPLHRARANAAAVVDEHGRCVGMLSPADVLRWVEAGCPEVVVGPVLRCPYQVRGRLLIGDEALICILAHGICPSQVEQPTTGGRHMDVCTRQAHEGSRFGRVPGYMTTDIVTVRPHTPLLELARQGADAHADCLIVVDEHDRPIGIVSAPDVLSHVPSGGIDDGRDRDGSLFAWRSVPWLDWRA